MRILLNSTRDEMHSLGGDFTHCRDWLRLNDMDDVGFRFEPVERAGVRDLGVFLRKGIEKACRTWQPATLRRRLLLLSRYLYVPHKSVEDADLIFSHLLFPLIPGQSDIPIVWNSQGISPTAYYERYNGGQWTTEDVAFIYSALSKTARVLTIATEACALNLLRWCPELAGKIHVVPAPVFVENGAGRAKPSERDGEIRLLFVGVDAVRKGLVEVIEALKTVRTRHRNLRLDIVSDPPARLRDEIERIPEARLHISSEDINVRGMMAEADIFLIPTHADTYALAAVEALAHRCAVIISDLEPLPEVVPDGRVGFNVPVGDSETLTRKLESLLGDDDLLRRMQDNAYDLYLERHHPNAVAERLRSAFEHATRGQNSGSHRQ
ncbi:MAG: glycosyltransferase family 4 protein [Candidatus Eisenbacteria bacterium]